MASGNPEGISKELADNAGVGGLTGDGTESTPVGMRSVSRKT